MKYRIKQEARTRSFPSQATAQAQNKKGTVRYKDHDHQPHDPSEARWPCRNTDHPGTEGAASEGASWSPCPQVGAICRHANCHTKLK